METIIIILLALAGSAGVTIPRYDGFSTAPEPAQEAQEGEQTSDDSAAASDETADMESENDEVASLEDAPEIEPVLAPPVVDTMRFDGDMGVVSGTAVPGSDIVIRDGDTEIARTQADANGNFAATFDYQTPEDGAILQLSQIDQDGVTTAAEEALSVLPQAGGDTQTATLTEEGVEVDATASHELALGQMSYGAVGTPWSLAGTATPGALVDLFINGEKIGSTTANENGEWSYEGDAVEPGQYEITLSENGGNSLTQNIVLAEQEPTQTAQAESESSADANASTPEATGSQSAGISAGQVIKVGDKVYVVKRGDSLWRIAEFFYGEGAGFRYTEIFDLNSGKIVNPHLIYPEQELDLPNVN